MTPPASLIDLGQEPEADDIVRPTKRARVDQPEEQNDSTTTLRHPLGVRPSGNALLADTNVKDAAGGFAILPDELIAILLESLDAPALLRLGGTCKALHAFTRNEELWRTLFTE